MKGLDAARAYWTEFGEPMLREQFPDLLPLLAAGLTGAGSECLGFDDDISRDHDFEPGFCLFLPNEDALSRRDAFLLERAYTKLPRSFMGLARGLTTPVGGPRRGVLRTQEYYNEKIGSQDGVLTVDQWLRLPEQALLEAVNGDIFFDGYGQVTREGADEMIALARRRLTEGGWRPYYLYRQKYMAGNLENVGYAKPGKACLYNIGNMEETVSVLALGAGAITKWLFDRTLRIERAPNVRNIEEYIARVDEMVERKREVIFSLKPGNPR